MSKNFAYFAYFACFAVVASTFGGVSSVFAAPKEKNPDADKYDAVAESKADDDKYDWTVLFDGQTTKNWIDLQDAGAIPLAVEDGALVLGMGSTTTSTKFDEAGSGIKLPRENYELEFVARRETGVDFFAAATFPVGDDHLTLVEGGWGGAVLGLSSIDYMDASENSTSTYRDFKNDRWYRFRVQVSKRAIRVWVDADKEIDYALEGHKLGTRFEVARCQPLGFASWVSKGAIRTIRVRALTDAELKELNDRADETAKFFGIGN